MFTLTTSNGTAALMKSGDPFLYSSRALAELGAKHLTKTLGSLTPTPF